MPFEFIFFFAPSPEIYGLGAEIFSDYELIARFWGLNTLQNLTYWPAESVWGVRSVLITLPSPVFIDGGVIGVQSDSAEWLFGPTFLDFMEAQNGQVRSYFSDSVPLPHYFRYFQTDFSWLDTVLWLHNEGYEALPFRRYVQQLDVRHSENADLVYARWAHWRRQFLSVSDQAAALEYLRSQTTVPFSSLAPEGENFGDYEGRRDSNIFAFGISTMVNGVAELLERLSYFLVYETPPLVFGFRALETYGYANGDLTGVVEFGANFHRAGEFFFSAPSPEIFRTCIPDRFLNVNIPYWSFGSPQFDIGLSSVWFRNFYLRSPWIWGFASDSYSLASIPSSWFFLEMDRHCAEAELFLPVSLSRLNGFFPNPALSHELLLDNFSFLRFYPPWFRLLLSPLVTPPSDGLDFNFFTRSATASEILPVFSVPFGVRLRFDDLVDNFSPMLEDYFEDPDADLDWWWEMAAEGLTDLMASEHRLVLERLPGFDPVWSLDSLYVAEPILGLLLDEAPVGLGFGAEGLPPLRRVGDLNGDYGLDVLGVLWAVGDVAPVGLPEPENTAAELWSIVENSRPFWVPEFESDMVGWFALSYGSESALVVLDLDHLERTIFALAGDGEAFSAGVELQLLGLLRDIAFLETSGWFFFGFSFIPEEFSDLASWWAFLEEQGSEMAENLGGLVDTALSAIGPEFSELFIGTEQSDDFSVNAPVRLDLVIDRPLPALPVTYEELLAVDKIQPVILNSDAERPGDWLIAELERTGQLKELEREEEQEFAEFAAAEDQRLAQQGGDLDQLISSANRTNIHADYEASEYQIAMAEALKRLSKDGIVGFSDLATKLPLRVQPPVPTNSEIHELVNNLPDLPSESESSKPKGFQFGLSDSYLQLDPSERMKQSSDQFADLQSGPTPDYRVVLVNSEQEQMTKLADHIASVYEVPVRRPRPTVFRFYPEDIPKPPPPKPVPTGLEGKMEIGSELVAVPIPDQVGPKSITVPLLDPFGNIPDKELNPGELATRRLLRNIQLEDNAISPSYHSDTDLARQLQEEEDAITRHRTQSEGLD